MRFLDQFSVWEILLGLVLILVVNTVVFKLLVDWNQSQPLDDGDSLVAPPGSGSISAGDLDNTASFATSVPVPNRPRRRKHLQPIASSTPSAPGVESRPAPAADEDRPPVEQPTPVSLSLSALPPADTNPVEPPPTIDPPHPVITFAPEVEQPALPDPEPAGIATEELAPEPSRSPSAPPEDPAPSPAPVLIPVLNVPGLTVPAAEVPIPVLLNTAPPEPAPELQSPAPDVKPAPEQPQHPESPLPMEPIPSVQDNPTSLKDPIPSSDLVFAPVTPAFPTPDPVVSAGSADAATPSTEPSPLPVPPRSSFRRGVAPARLFLTREFSSVRIRSRHLAGSEPAPVPPAPPEFVPVVESSPTAALKLAPVVEVEPVSQHEEPGATTEVLSAQPPAIIPEPEPVVVPTVEVLPVVESTPPAPANETSSPVEAFTEAAPPALREPEPAAHPEPAAPEAAPTVTVIPAAVSEPGPVEEPAANLAPVPELAEEVAAPVPVLADVPTMHVPEPSETLPVVDTTPEPSILPPPAPGRLIQPEPVVTQPIAPFIPTPTMASVQPVTGERATAQLTLSLEVASLQLTPAFRLGSVQLRPLSNVVSLQLGAGVGPQPAANPLAANISFEIQSVQTGGDGQIQSLVLKPLSQARADTTPQPRLQVDAVQLTRGTENAPIQITPAQATSTAVQLLTTYAIAGIDFTPNFEIGTMRLEPSTRTVMLRLNQPGGADLPPAFEIANVQVGGDGQISMVQLTPTTL